MEIPIMILQFDDEGSGPGAPIVLLHGFPLDRTMFVAQAEALRPNHRVIRPDLRGHGASPAPGGVYTMDEMADDVLETLESLNVRGPFVLGGLSMGGYVALSIAVRFPTRVGALILMNTKATADSAEAAANRERTARGCEEAGSPEGAIESMLPRLVSPAHRSEHQAVLQRLEARTKSMTLKGFVGILRGLAIRPDRIAELPKIISPALIIAGADDVLIPVTEAERMARGLPSAQIEILPGIGHLAPLEAPEATNRAIFTFLTGLQSS
jgi:pimeloyl-ACP methyl ester carboxylesterase